jgi:EmrB/QacA subfamily drug resistance transporter
MADHPDHGVARRLFAARLTASLMPLNSTMVAVAVPAVAAEFEHSATTVTQALVATYLITAIALQSPGGKLADRFGQWRVLRSGQAAIASGALLALVAPDLATLTVARVLMACGGALVVPATIALMRVVLPPDRRGRAFGTFGAVMALAAAVGPVLGGVLVEAFSWEAVFLANVPVLALAALVGANVPPAVPPAPASHFDWWGSVLLTVGLVLVVVGTQGGRAWSLLVLAGGAAVLAAFAWWESRTRDPVVDFRLFRSVPFAAGSVLVALQNLVMYALLFELPLVLDDLFGSSAREIGQLLTILTVAMVVMSLLAGRLTDRFGPRPVAVAGALLCLVGLLVLDRSGLSAPGDVRVPLALLGAGLGLSSPAAQSASLSGISPRQSGMAAGAASTMRYLGAVVGIALLGRLLDLDGSRAQVLAEHRVVLVVFAVALAGSLVCAAVLPRRAGRAALAQADAVTE